MKHSVAQHFEEESIVFIHTFAICESPFFAATYIDNTLTVPEVVATTSYD